MPLVIMCGIPSSGKTLRARKLFEELKFRGIDVHLISEADELAALNMTKDTCFANSNNEKQLRAALKAKTISLINHKTTVILDSSNYIKGYRYELYCASKSCKTTQCTIYTIININEASKLNENRRCTNEKLGKQIENSPYSKETFDALVLRFEEPNSNNRWDSPLFTTQYEDDLNIEDIYKALYERKPPPPNMSTQNPPLSDTNFLYELDKTIQEISSQILEFKKINPNSEMHFPAYPTAFVDSECMEKIQPGILLKLRRQFLTFAKLQYSNHNPIQIGGLYIQYINSNLKS